MTHSMASGTIAVHRWNCCGTEDHYVTEVGWFAAALQTREDAFLRGVLARHATTFVSGSYGANQGLDSRCRVLPFKRRFGGVHSVLLSETDVRSLAVTERWASDGNSSVTIAANASIDALAQAWVDDLEANADIEHELLERSPIVLSRGWDGLTARYFSPRTVDVVASVMTEAEAAGCRVDFHGQPLLGVSITGRTTRTR